MRVIPWTMVLAILLKAAACGSSTASQPDEPSPEETQSCPGTIDNDVEVVTEVVAGDDHFVDHCNAEGNLVEHECATDTDLVCDDAGNCMEQVVSLATTVERVVDCNGTCQAGVCASACPQVGHEVRFEGEQDGELVVTNLTTGQQLGCELNTDCTEVEAGTTWKVGSPIPATHACLGSDTFWLPGPSGSDCAFRCSG